MIKFGKTSQQAIMALTCLAIAYDKGATAISTEQIARDRSLSKPLLSKLLGTLSKAKIVGASHGPHGGYWLAKPPQEITLLAIARIFEPKARPIECPLDSCHLDHRPVCAFGKGLEEQRKSILHCLSSTTLADLLKARPTCRDPSPGQESPQA